MADDDPEEAGRAILRKFGYDDEQIASMSPEQRSAEIAEAKAAAEPSDIPQDVKSAAAASWNPSDEIAQMRRQIASRNTTLIVVCGLLVTVGLAYFTPRPDKAALSYCGNLLTAQAYLEDAGGDQVQPVLDALKAIAAGCPTEPPDNYPD